MVIQVYAPTSNTEEAEVERFYEDQRDLLELTPQKRRPFHYRGLECKSRKPSDTWGNRQVWPWWTKWSRANAKRVLPRQLAGHSKHLLATTQETTLRVDFTRWSIPKSDWLYSFSQRWRSSIQSAKIRPGADYGSNHEFLIKKFRLKLKKLGKTTRPFRYDLNQIPYDHTVEVVYISQICLKD